jgi:hypothetical protein
MNAISNEAYSKTLRNLQDIEYRELFRKMQVSSALHRELNATFRTRGRRKNFDLGLSSIDFDCTIFGFLPPDICSLEVSYRKKNLSFLDDLLGLNWDIQSIDGQTKFVTSIKIRLTTQLSLTGTIRVADYDTTPLEVNTDYRGTIANHLSYSA